MSKAALFAGLGQGLMAAGQTFGRAYEQISLEKLRQENLERNWKRDDRLRAEDRAWKDKIRTEDLEYRKGRDAATDAHRATVLENQAVEREANANHRTAVLENQANLQEMTKAFQIETQKARTAAANAATVEAQSKATQDLIKIQDDQYSKVVSPLDKQLEELTKAASDPGLLPGDRERFDAQILKLKEDRAFLVENLFGEGFGVEGSIGYREAKMISGLRERIPGDPKPSESPLPSVADTLKNRGSSQQEQGQGAHGGLMDHGDSKKKYGDVSIGEATGVAPLVKAASEGFSNWNSGNDALAQAWENPKAIDSMDAEQLQMLISRRGDDNRWSSRITRARTRLSQLQG